MAARKRNLLGTRIVLFNFLRACNNCSVCRIPMCALLYFHMICCYYTAAAGFHFWRFNVHHQFFKCWLADWGMIDKLLCIHTKWLDTCIQNMKKSCVFHLLHVRWRWWWCWPTLQKVIITEAHNNDQSVTNGMDKNETILFLWFSILIRKRSRKAKWQEQLITRIQLRNGDYWS